MRLFATISLVAFVFFANAQNLVVNPSFETVNLGSLQCSWYTSNAQFVAAISNWDYPTNGSTDVYHTSLATSCYSSPFSTHASSNGSQAPRTGNSMVAIVTYGSGGCTPYREYVQGELSAPMTVGTTYDIEFYVSLADNMTHATNNIGVKFTTARQSTGSMCVWNAGPEVNYTGAPITDKVGWTLMSFSYTPTVTGLQYFSIGNFFSDAATTATPVTGTKSTIRYYVDDVSISSSCPVFNASWTNPSPICASAGSINLDALVTGTTGGTWSGTGVSGSTFNPASGTQSVTYTVGTPGCEEVLTQTITVIPDVNPAWTNPSPICASAGSINLDALITGTTGGTWSGTGVSGSTFNPASGTQSVTYTVGTSPCQETSVQTITVLPDVNPAWTNPGTICATAGSINLDALITGTTGGTWSGTGVSGSTFNPASGTQSVTYTVGTSPCQETSVQTITVAPDVDPSWTNPGSICASAAPINLDALITGTTGGTWSGTGVSGNTFNPASGTQSVTYTVGTSPCQETSVQTITVAPDVDPTWTNPGPICATAGPINLDALITGTTGGTWSGTGVSGSTFNPASGTQSVTYTVGTSPCQETSVQTITVAPDVDPAWTNPGTICASAGIINLDALITGTTGGTWSGTGVSGSNFDPASGTQSVTYTVGTSPCQETSSQTITVIPDVDPSWTNPGTICVAAGSINLDALITGTTGGTWSGTGVSGSNFDPASGTQSVTYTVGTSPCQETSVQTITVAPDVDPLWTNPGTICASAGMINLDALITGTTGGTWSGTGVSGSNFDPASGTQSVTYTVGTSPCQETSVQTITVIPDVDPTWTNPGPLCEASGSIDLNTLVTGTAGGTWSGTGVSGSNFDPAGLTGTVDITYQVGTAPCDESLQLTVTILQEDDPSFSYSAGTFCVTGTDPTPTITGTTGGTFTISPSGTIDPVTGVIDLAATGVGTYTVTYNTAAAGGACPQSTTAVVTITSSPSATFNYDASQYCQNDPNPVLTYGPGAGGGVFTATPTGLALNSSTGDIDLVTSTAGTYMIYNFIAAGSGCSSALDSIQVTIFPMYSFNTSASICAGDSMLVGGAFQTTSGTYMDTLATTMGCDSIIATTLTVLPFNVTTIVDSICQGDSILLGGSWQTTAGTYSDTLVSSSGCDSIVSTTLTVTPLNTISVTPGGIWCVGDVVSLVATGTGTGTINWYSDAAGSTIVGTGGTFTPGTTTPGVYAYYVGMNGTCSSALDSVSFEISDVVASFSPNPSTGLIPLDVTMNNSSSTGAGYTYTWDFGDGDTSSIYDPTHIYTGEGTYDVVLVVDNGTCTDTAFATIVVNDESHLIIPNIFTPNGDGVNDVFLVNSSNLISIQADIFNRWGQLVYTWDMVNAGWDGRTTAGDEASAGTYFYVINAEGADGEIYFEKGPLVLKR